MKYIAVFDDKFLSNFRIDNEDILVLQDENTFIRGIKLKPLPQKRELKEE